MIKSMTDWRLSITNSSSPKIVNNFVRTTDTSLSELAMRQVNNFFESLGISEEQLMQQFEQNRGEAFERFYDSVENKCL